MRCELPRLSPRSRTRSLLVLPWLHPQRSEVGSPVSSIAQDCYWEQGAHAAAASFRISNDWGVGDEQAQICTRCHRTKKLPIDSCLSGRCSWSLAKSTRSLGEQSVKSFRRSEVSGNGPA